VQLLPDKLDLTANGDQTRYQFNTHKIDHLFCPTCGIQSFARGTAPNGQETVAINVRSLDGLDPWTLTPQQVDGASF
jgi:hypothetical protein